MGLLPAELESDTNEASGWLRASGPSFRNSLTKSTAGRVSSVPPLKSAKSSPAEGSSSGAFRDLLQQSACMEFASEQAGCWKQTLSPGLVGSLALDLPSPKADLVGRVLGLRSNVKE